jgi:hypothetical protein
MNSHELDIAELNRTIETSEALTTLLFVEEIARYRPFDPAEVSISPISLDESLDERIATELGANLRGAVDDDTISKIIVNAEVNDLLEITRYGATEAYLLYWHGSCRVPKGVSIGDKIISQTKWGFVKDNRGEFVGTYHRLIDQETLNGDYTDPSNAMLVFI